MREFLRRHVDPATRLGEALFGLIMALGITGAVRLGLENATNRELFVAVLGCNVAWGIVDGVMFSMRALFERGRKARLVKTVRDAPTDKAALEHIHEELGARLEPLITPEDRDLLYRQILDASRRLEPEPVRLQRQDVFGGIAVGMLILVATMPIVIPFVLITDSKTAIWASNVTTLGLLFWVGSWWGRIVGANPIRIGAGVASIGLILVLITIALGG